MAPVPDLHAVVADVLGAWILIFVYPVLAAMSLVRPPTLLAAFFPVLDEWSEALNRRPRVLKVLAAISMVSGIALGIYTGVLLSAWVRGRSGTARYSAAVPGFGVVGGRGLRAHGRARPGGRHRPGPRR